MKYDIDGHVYWAPQRKLGSGWVCFKDSPQPPPAPDYTSAAQATASGNIDAARLATRANRVDQYSPYGSQTYKDLGGDRWQQDTSLTPMGQQLLDQQNKTSAGLANLQDGATARVGAMAGSTLPAAYDPNQSTNNATQLLMNRQQPMLDHDQEALRTQLVNQGLDPSSEAYKRSMDQFGRQKNDAYSQASLQGITLGQNQQQQTYNQATANRNIPINELNAIRTGSQVTNPTFGNVPTQGQTAGPDYMSAATGQNQYNLGLYNSQVGQNNATTGMLGQIGAAGLTAMKFSDRRLKRNIKPIGKTPGGINFYSYEYLWGERSIGVMADEVTHIPGAVRQHASGFKMVDYSKVA